MNAFDPDRAAFRTIVLACRDVIDPLAVTHAPARVSEYRSRMIAGDRFPPVSVLRIAGRYLLVDGHKRFTAYRKLGHTHLVVEIWPLSRWLQDQGRQLRDNGRKNVRILVMSVRHPVEARRLLLATVLHWHRVAKSLLLRATGRLR
jgi:hypothetical protein